MITRAKFENFKALRDVEITFDSRLTVLVGPNGSGKTSVLEGVDSLCNLVQRSGPKSRLGASTEIDQLASRGNPREMSLELIGGQSPDDWVRFQAKPKLALHTREKIGGWENRISWNSGDSIEEDGGKESRLGKRVNPAFSRLGCAQFLRLDTKHLASARSTHGKPPRLRTNGKNLASVLAYLEFNKHEQFELIIAELRQIIPTVERIRFDREPVGSPVPNSNNFSDPRTLTLKKDAVTGDRLIIDFQGAFGIRASQASEGTLHMLALITAICGPDRPRILLLDDLGQSLHPKVQMQLVDLLRKLLDRYPDLQVIATSHSPYVLDRLAPNEVRVMALNQEGSASCARLEDHPKYPIWKDSMSPGEFWSHVGEDWVKDLAVQTTNP